MQDGKEDSSGVTIQLQVVQGTGRAVWPVGTPVVSALHLHSYVLEMKGRQQSQVCLSLLSHVSLVAPPGSGGTALLLARTATPEQAAFIGRQTGGRVFLFLSTDDFWRDYADMLAAGIRFVRPPQTAAYGTVAVFEDLYGNLWDLIGPNSQEIT